MIKTINSFAALGEAWNKTHYGQVSLEPKPTKEKPRKCRICGADMERINGSNVYVCHGMIEKSKPTEDNPDAKEQVACGNFALSKK